MSMTCLAYLESGERKGHVCGRKASNKYKGYCYLHRNYYERLYRQTCAALAYDREDARKNYKRPHSLISKELVFSESSSPVHK